MALTGMQQAEIQRKAELGLALVNETPEAVRLYNKVREIKRKAEQGIPLIAPDYWAMALYSKYAKSGYVPPSPAGGTGQSGNIGGSNQSGNNTPLYPNTPPLDQTPPVIGNPDTGNKPAVPIGTGDNNPVNKMELNSIVAVVAGFFFIRGAFKLLTKLF